MEVRMDAATCGAQRSPLDIRIGSQGELADAIVWVDGERVLAWPENLELVPETVFTLKACSLSPVAAMVAPRKPLKIINEDPILHTIRAKGSRNYPLFRSIPPQLEFVTMRFDHPEIVPLTSDTHPWIRGSLAVAPHQNYAVSDVKGSVILSKVPLGSKRLSAWHPLLGTYVHPEPVIVTEKKIQITIQWPSQQ
jgi:hypothetical protein